MTVLASTTFTGGAIGAAVTTTSEPIFSSKGGTVIYGAGPGSTQGMRPSSSSAGNMFIASLPGSTATFRIGWKYTHGSSTAATGIYRMVQLRNSTTLVSDVSLRNNAGTREAALRNSSTSTVQGQATGDPVTAGSTWTFEWSCVSSNSTVKVWKNSTATGSPDYTWTQTGLSSTTPYNVIFGPDASTGVDGVISEVTITDGSVIYAGAGSLDIALNGASESTAFNVLAKMTGSTSNRLKYSVNSNMTSASFTTAAAADAAGYQVFTPTGLTANTTYYWQVEVDGVVNTTLSGQTRTLRTSGTATSFRFGWASCFDTFTSGVFALVAARTPEFFIQLGDYGYQYITGGANGNTAPASTAQCRTDREAALSPTGPRTLFANVPFDQMYSDCDGGGANSDGTFAGFVGGNVQAAWRQQFGNRTLPLTDCGARSWVVGRLRFIITDETTLASDKTATDTSSKSKLGATQKAWFKGQIDAAAAAGQYIIWCGDGPWIEATNNTGSGNTWARYNTERTEIGSYVAAAGMSGRMIRLHGDTHTLFADDGSHNSWGGFANFSAAPMHTTGQAFGTTVSNGSFPTGTVNSSRQYAICDVTDSGGAITLAMAGYSSTVSAPTETNPVNMTLVSGSQTATSSIGVSSTAAGAVGTSAAATSSLTVASSATGGGAVNSAATGPTTSTATAAGTVGRSTGSTASTSVSASATGATGVSRAATSAIGVTASGTGDVPTPGGTEPALNITTTATGSAGSTGAATRPVSVASASSGATGASAALTATATTAVATAGQLGVNAAVAATATLASLTAGSLGVSVAASGSLGISTTASGLLGATGHGNAQLDVSAVAAGVTVAAGDGVPVPDPRGTITTAPQGVVVTTPTPTVTLIGA